MIEKVAQDLDKATEEALVTHGKFDTLLMARVAIEALLEPNQKIKLLIEKLAALSTPEEQYYSIFNSDKVWEELIHAALAE